MDNGNRSNQADPTTKPIPSTLSGQLVSVEDLRSILEESLPQDEIVYAFAYGSGVLSQRNSGNDKSTNDKNMIDFVVVVRDAYRFHEANLSLNPHHYAGPFVLSSDRADRVTWWQRHVAFGVENSYFRNPGIYFNVTDSFKYGVVQVDDLVEDLTDWKYLYLAGRMHKPIVTLIDRQLAPSGEDTNNRWDLVQRQQEDCNLPAALASSLLLLSLEQEKVADDNDRPSTQTDFAIYKQIAALSYAGDPRMTAGAEDPKKVDKLVSSPGQMKRFSALYEAAMSDLQSAGILSRTPITVGRDCDNNNRIIGTASPHATSTVAWDSTNAKARAHLWQKLPPSLQSLPTSLEKEGSDPRLALAAALPAIVAPAARYQSIKGLATAGLVKSLVYAARKLSKGILKR